MSFVTPHAAGGEACLAVEVARISSGSAALLQNVWLQEKRKTAREEWKILWREDVPLKILNVSVKFLPWKTFAYVADPKLSQPNVDYPTDFFNLNYYWGCEAKWCQYCYSKTLNFLAPRLWGTAVKKNLTIKTIQNISDWKKNFFATHQGCHFDLRKRHSSLDGWVSSDKAHLSLRVGLLAVIFRVWSRGYRTTKQLLERKPFVNPESISGKKESISLHFSRQKTWWKRENRISQNGTFKKKRVKEGRRKDKKVTKSPSPLRAKNATNVSWLPEASYIYIHSSDRGRQKIMKIFTFFLCDQPAKKCSSKWYKILGDSAPAAG